MQPVLLYRESLLEQEELEVARQYFTCTPYRTAVAPNSLVIGRYSCLPFYAEQYADMQHIGARLINTPAQHDWIADVGRWACEGGVLEGLTPKTYTRLVDVPDGGPYVLKGKTNSRKHSWSSLMFAQDKKAACDVYYRLLDDTLIGQQDIYIRQYVPFKKLMEGINGMPVTVEFRFFVAYGEILSGGYYWSSHVEDLPEVPQVSMVPQDFISKVVDQVKHYADFVVIDVGQLEDGSWMVVELNDGQQSGLSENDPHKVYGNLRKIIDRRQTLSW